MFDFLIVGAGYAGSVLAERLARDANKKVLIVDRRPHIAGNAYDHYNDAGILVHRYGPHIFHTNSKDIFEYLSRFTQWRQYQHRVLASVDGQLLPIPINLDTVNKMYGLSLTSFQVEEFFESVAEKKEQIRTSEDVVVNKVGRELYEKFFRNYTRKQWGLDPSELDAAVTARVPTRTNRDDRYFTDNYQAMPLHGFTRMFENMLDHPNIKIMLNTDYRDIKEFVPYKEMIYTGQVDEFFDNRFGKLPYRSLEFKHETHDVEWYQEAPVVNYPNDYLYTRIRNSSTSAAKRTSRPALCMNSRRPRATRITRFRGPKTPSCTRSMRHWLRKRPACISWDVWRLTSTTTWTKSWARHCRCIRRSWARKANALHQKKSSEYSRVLGAFLLATF
jgi:UDP-galactopyranose mutase